MLNEIHRRDRPACREVDDLLPAVEQDRIGGDDQRVGALALQFLTSSVDFFFVARIHGNRFNVEAAGTGFSILSLGVRVGIAGIHQEPDALGTRRKLMQQLNPLGAK